MNIVDFIPYGSENAVTREQLVILTGLNDRKVRDAISHAKRETAIVNVGKGYFIPTENDAAELNAYIKQEESKALNILAGLKYLKGQLADYRRGIYE